MLGIYLQYLLKFEIILRPTLTTALRDGNTTTIPILCRDHRSCVMCHWCLDHSFKRILSYVVFIVIEIFLMDSVYLTATVLIANLDLLALIYLCLTILQGYIRHGIV